MGWVTSWLSGPIVTALGVSTAALSFGILLLAWRSPVLRKLGGRNVARRKLRAGLIVVGLMLSTMVVGSAFAVGDSMNYTLRSLVADNFGSVDEVVVAQPPRVRFGARLQAATTPGLGMLGAAGLSFFDRYEVDRVLAAAGRSAAIAGTVPGILDQVSAVHEGNQRLQSALPLLAVQLPTPPAFGPLRPSQGSDISWEALGPDDVVLNAAAAVQMGAAVEDALTLLRDGEAWSVRVGAIVGNTGIAGSQPLVIVPLTRYQQVVSRPGEVNVVLVANVGGVDSVERSEEATRALRAQLSDRDVAQQLHNLLRRADAQQGLVEVEGWLDGRDRVAIATLRTEAALPRMTERFISLIAEPQTRQRLLSLAWVAPGWSDQQALSSGLRELTTLSVLEVKQRALDQAHDLGAAITTLFLVLGIFSIAAAIMLVFLIFGLLAADRRSELATLRAIGLRRRQLMVMFLFEGWLYAAVGAALGTVATLLSGYVIVSMLSDALESWGLSVDPYVDPRSLFVGFTLGFVLTAAAMFLAVWRASRLEIVAATRGVAIEENHVPRFVLGAFLVALAAVIWFRWRIPSAAYLPRHPLVVPASLSSLLLGTVCCITPLLSSRRHEHSAAQARGLAGLTGLAIAGVWLHALVKLPTSGVSTIVDAVTLSVGGLALILVMVYTATQAMGRLLRLLDYVLSFTGRIRAVVRPAAAYLTNERWRTGLTVLMFATVIFIMTVSLVLIDSLLGAYGGAEPPVAGFDLRADWGSEGSHARIDMASALAHAPAISADAFTAIGSLASHEVQIVPLGLPSARWEAETLVVVDDGFLEGIRAGMQRIGSVYDSNIDVWRAVRDRPGTAVITARSSDSILRSAFREDQPFQSITVWARPRSGVRPFRLTVIGVVDARSQLEEGIYISQTTAADLNLSAAAPGMSFFAVDPGTRIADAIEGLRLSFADQGMRVVDIGDELRLVTALRLLLTRFVQSFMALGLLAGSAALGLLGVQSIIERRRQLGALRALGFTRWQMRSTLAIESTVIAVVGVVVGIGLGLFLSRALVAVLAASFPELHYATPWKEIAFTASLAWSASALAIGVAMWEAGRVSPIEAMQAT